MPSTVDTVTYDAALGYSNQRRVWYANGRLWYFYHDGTYLAYKTSLDGINWSSKATLDETTTKGFSVWFDGSYFQMARYNSSTHNLSYIMYLPRTTGTLSANQPASIVYDGETFDECTCPYICVDSNGYAWIGTVYISGTTYYCRVFKNAKKDGTWSDDTGFPYDLASYSSATAATVLTPLTNGKVYAIYGAGPCYLKGKLWDGSSWGSEETIGDYEAEDVWDISTVANGDTLHLVYIRSGTYQLRHNYRNGTGWQSSDNLVQDNVNQFTGPAMCMDGSDIYCFWLYNNYVYYKKYSGGSWDSIATQWIDETSDTLPDEMSISVMYQSEDTVKGVGYVSGSSSPYKVKFAYLGQFPTCKRVTMFFSGDVLATNDEKVYQLKTSPGASSSTGSFFSAPGVTQLIGIRVWKVSDSTETEITEGTPVAIADISFDNMVDNMDNIKVGTWNCSQITLSPSDELRIRIYIKTGDGEWTAVMSGLLKPYRWDTQNLNVVSIEASKWKVSYHVRMRESDDTKHLDFGGPFDTAIQDFRYIPAVTQMSETCDLKDDMVKNMILRIRERRIEA